MDTVTFLLHGLWTTAVITVASFLIGAVLGIPVALARLSDIAPLRWLATAYVEVLRGVPPIAWMLLLFYGLSQWIQLDPMLVACLALGAIATAYSPRTTGQASGRSRTGSGRVRTRWGSAVATPSGASSPRRASVSRCRRRRASPWVS